MVVLSRTLITPPALRPLSLIFLLVVIWARLATAALISDALLSCLQSSGISTVTSNSSTFAQDSLAFNRRFEYTPAAIVFPRSTQDVAIAVKCASSVNGTIPVSARSGGHSYGAFSLGGQDGTLVIDLSNLKNITVNQDYTANIQTGNRLGDVALALFANGERALAHGTCPYVGIGGHAGCGGFGLASRAWGLVLDQIESAEVVIANGTVLRASESINSDLFWALRGASPSFGIVTEYKVRTQSAPPSNIVFSYAYSVDPSVASEILASFQFFSQYSAPPELGLQLSVIPSRQPGIITLSLIGIYMGSLTTFNTIIAPLISSVPVSPRTTNVTQFEWIPSLVRKGGIGTLDTSLRLDASDTFFAKSLMVPHDAVLTPSAIRALFDYLAAEGVSTDTKWFVLADLFGGEGSIISDIPHNSTAYAHRKGLYNFQMYASSLDLQPPFPIDGIDFLNNLYNSITSNMPSNWSFGAYPCYADPTLSDIQWQTQYYGDHYPILQSIHSKYNPSSLFRYPQAVAA
ncbi:hypothetical protein PTI98_001920 [Pleurotus ostreatus]|nr:hypothetical protein CCMSSC00406_0007013 [Pleurotus cornucopiae]KAJ8703285.1 hypothetical protein PTI98_001920 [Pleurotus ostreatus]KDQ30242.1 hypothetical protein PLEOSDRAFT_1037246 [Pleurotus ostreatus PC15]